MFAPRLAEIAELEQTVAEARSIADIARNDLQNSSGMEWPTFNEFVKPVESKVNAPWLRRFTEEGKEVIRVVDLQDHRARVATPDEIRDGKFYKDLAEYQADRAA